MYRIRRLDPSRLCRSRCVEIRRFGGRCDTFGVVIMEGRELFNVGSRGQSQASPKHVSKAGQPRSDPLMIRSRSSGSYCTSLAPGCPSASANAPLNMTITTSAQMNLLYTHPGSSSSSFSLTEHVLLLSSRFPTMTTSWFCRMF